MCSSDLFYLVLVIMLVSCSQGNQKKEVEPLDSISVDSISDKLIDAKEEKEVSSIGDIVEYCKHNNIVQNPEMDSLKRGGICILAFKPGNCDILRALREKQKEGFKGWCDLEDDDDDHKTHWEVDGNIGLYGYKPNNFISFHVWYSMIGFRDDSFGYYITVCRRNNKVYFIALEGNDYLNGYLAKEHAKVDQDECWTYRGFEPKDYYGFVVDKGKIRISGSEDKMCPFDVEIPYSDKLKFKYIELDKVDEGFGIN